MPKGLFIYNLRFLCQRQVKHPVFWSTLTVRYDLWKKAVVLRNSTPSFWLLFSDIDEFLVPPRSKKNLVEFLLPYTHWRPNSGWWRSLKQIQCFQKMYGAGSWSHASSSSSFSCFGAQFFVSAFVHHAAVRGTIDRLQACRTSRPTRNARLC